MNIDTALGSIFRMTEGDFYSIDNIDNIVSGESSDNWDSSELIF